MTQPSTTPPEPEKKFTQADLDRVVADRLARERGKYADYDELKQQAQAAAGSKSQLDKIQEQLTKAEERATKAEREAIKSSVAQELGLTPRQARKLEGGNREEMLADGREILEDFGIKKTDGTTNDGAAGEGGNAQAGSGDGGSTGQPAEQEPQRRAPRGRPTESLKSGAPISEPATEETDPLKLAAGVARRF